MLDTLDHPGGIRELRLARPPVNALDAALLAALRKAIVGASRDRVAGLILSGSPGLFSAGLDIPSLVQLDRAAMRGAWDDFLGVCAALACAPMPVVAAVTGHSPAGGAVFAIFCDYRVMARGAFRIGLNEVQVGLMVPGCIQAALRRLIGTHPAERLMVSGTLLEADAAHAAGMVDELADVADVVPRARAWLAALLQLPRQPMLATRAIARADLAALFEAPESPDAETFLDAWFTPDTQAALHALVAQLHAKRQQGKATRSGGTHTTA